MIWKLSTIVFNKWNQYIWDVRVSSIWTIHIRWVLKCVARKLSFFKKTKSTPKHSTLCTPLFWSEVLWSVLQELYSIFNQINVESKASALWAQSHGSKVFYSALQGNWAILNSIHLFLIRDAVIPTHDLIQTCLACFLLFFFKKKS